MGNQCKGKVKKKGEEFPPLTFSISYLAAAVLPVEKLRGVDEPAGDTLI